MIVLDAKMAGVALVERGKGVCLFHWGQLRARNNVCVSDEVGKKQPTFGPGTK